MHRTRRQNCNLSRTTSQRPPHRLPLRQSWQSPNFGPWPAVAIHLYHPWILSRPTSVRAPCMKYLKEFRGRLKRGRPRKDLHPLLWVWIPPVKIQLEANLRVQWRQVLPIRWRTRKIWLGATSSACMNSSSCLRWGPYPTPQSSSKLFRRSSRKLA